MGENEEKSHAIDQNMATGPPANSSKGLLWTRLQAKYCTIDSRYRSSNANCYLADRLSSWKSWLNANIYFKRTSSPWNLPAKRPCIKPKLFLRNISAPVFTGENHPQICPKYNAMVFWLVNFTPWRHLKQCKCDFFVLRCKKALNNVSSGNVTSEIFRKVFRTKYFAFCFEMS